MVALTAYSALILLQNATILLEARHLTPLNGAVVGGSLGAFCLLMGLVGRAPANASYGVLGALLLDGRFWLCLPLLLFACLAPVLACKVAAQHPACLTRSDRLALRLGSHALGSSGGAEPGGAEPRALLFGLGRSARRAKKDF